MRNGIPPVLVEIAVVDQMPDDRLRGLPERCEAVPPKDALEDPGLLDRQQPRVLDREGLLAEVPAPGCSGPR
jgi:hypothetical protein